MGCTPGAFLFVGAPRVPPVDVAWRTARSVHCLHRCVRGLHNLSPAARSSAGGVMMLAGQDLLPAGCVRRRRCACCEAGDAMPEKKILVTGSTGATGTPTVRLLFERGLAVRALVRRQDQRSELLESLGAEIMEGDLLDYNAVRGMLAGVDRALFVFPVRPGLLDATAYFAQAAAEAELDVVVNLSHRTARRDTESHAAQNHWVAEQVFDQFAAPVVHLRPTFFADWFLYFTYMVKAGVVRFPFGTGGHAPITALAFGLVSSPLRRCCHCQPSN
jgi:hypothetical protein